MLYFADGDGDGGVALTPDAAPEGVTESPTVETETSAVPENVAGSETAAEAQPTEVDPLEGVPAIEELEKLAAQKIPNSIGLLNLRKAYEATRPIVDEHKELLPWKEVSGKLDPAQALEYQSLVNKIHSPAIDPQTQQEIPGQFTTVPFLQDLEAQSPGTIDQIFADLLTVQVPDAQGNPSRLDRELLKSWGLNPDKIEDYRNIDQRAPSSGFVTPDQLVGIDPKFHAAFGKMSQSQREDVLTQRIVDTATGNVSYPAHVLDNLQDKADALSARELKETIENRDKAADEAAERAWETKTAQAVQDDISTIKSEMYDSITQSLSQVQFSSDPVIDAVERLKTMATAVVLIDPDLRKLAKVEEVLSKVGANFAPDFDEKVGALAGNREAYVRFTAMNDSMRAKAALGQANFARAQLMGLISDYANKVAKPGSQNLAMKADATRAALSGAAARPVPSGAVSPQGGDANPYANNPYQMGTPEWRAYYKDMDKQLGVSSAAVFGA